jgi:hypothetical protein
LSLKSLFGKVVNKYHILETFVLLCRSEETECIISPLYNVCTIRNLICWYFLIHQIKLQLNHKSPDYKVTSYYINKLCVCGDAGQSVKFTIIPTNLGHIPLTVTATTSSARLCSNSTVSVSDAVTRKLLVEVCKFSSTFTHSLFLSLQHTRAIGWAKSYSCLLAQPIAHRVRVHFTEFYASCNLFSRIKHVWSVSYRLS